MTEAELLGAAYALEGRAVAEIAAELGIPAADTRRAKGWTGQVVEAALGAEAGNRPVPDFEELGVELKTVPVREGRPRESTFVATAPVEGRFEGTWEGSHPRRKLARVLWVPVGDGRVGRARLWSPSPEEDAVLATDWRMLTELLAEGAFHRIHAGLGRVLQLRPKAAGKDDFAWMIDEEGEWVRQVRYGFYLRARFTTGILAAR